MNRPTPKTSPFTILNTELPDELIDGIIKTLEDANIQATDRAGILGDDVQHVAHRIRDTNKIALPGNHWYFGMIWYFIMRMNDWNFQYNIDSFDGDSIQYLEYNPGQHYTWHTDSVMPVITNHIPRLGIMPPTGEEKVRKLSFSLMLNDDYEGGDLQFYFPAAKRPMNTVPKKKGMLVIFDSRIVHRVTRVREGKRKSIVGWVVGPRWK